MEKKSSIIFIRVPDHMKEDLLKIVDLKGERQATIIRAMVKNGIKKSIKELKREGRW